MLQTLLTWHVTATVALLAVYLLVVVVQWAVARARSARSLSAAVVVPAVRLEGETGLPAVGTAA